MKQVEDTKTVDWVLPNRPRGRPPTGVAMTAAEKQKARRERLKASGVEPVTMNLDAEVMEALRNFTKYKDETLGQAASRILRDRLLRKR